MLWVIGISVLATSLMLVLLQNFKTPEKVLERKVEHRYAVSDPQFRREMSVLPGPAIVGGNRWVQPTSTFGRFGSMTKRV